MADAQEKFRFPKLTNLGMYLYFIVPSPGYQLLLKFFLNKNTLSFSYIVLASVFGIRVALMMERLMMRKPIKQRVFAGLILVTSLIFINWLVRFV